MDKFRSQFDGKRCERIVDGIDPSSHATVRFETTDSLSCAREFQRSRQACHTGSDNSDIAVLSPTHGQAAAHLGKYVVRVERVRLGIGAGQKGVDQTFRRKNRPHLADLGIGKFVT